VWANSYDGDVADSLAVMAQVANAITGEIRKALAGSDAEPHAPPPPPPR
jgi:TolB-like protein